MRLAWRCLMVLLFVSVPAFLAAQDHAKPRDDSRPPREAPPRTGHPTPEAAPRQPSGPPPSGAGPVTAPDAPRRHPQPGTLPPMPPNARREAERRHPRPEPNDAYRGGRYDWQHWQYDWWYPRGHFYLFPDRYPGVRWSYRYRGFSVYPHVRLPYEDDWFYWPYANAYQGCGWYWVPTRRTRILDPEFGWVYKYRRYRYVYVCFD